MTYAIGLTRLRRARGALVRRAWIVLALCAGFAPVGAQELAILRYERLADLAIGGGDAAADGSATGVTLSFTAFGTRFVVELTRNEALTRNLLPEIRQRLAAEFYTGVVAGRPDSWARLTRTGGELSGAIWDGTELYAIESFARVSAHVVAGPEVGAAEPVIYRWSDTLSALIDDVAAPAAAGPPARAKPLAAPLSLPELAVLQTKLAPARQLNIGLLSDSEFVRTQGANAEAEMLSIANVVDGIFFDQVGVHINVAELRAYGVEPEAFSGTDARALLDQLEAFKFDTPALRGQGLVHLLTGRDLDERQGMPAGARLLGVANLGVVCEERLGVSITQYTTLSTAVVVAAHELGHNFGAPHDSEVDSPCAATPQGLLMSPFVNGSRQFSACSIEQMAPELAAAVCLTNLPANDLSVQRLSAPAEVIATRQFDIAFAVDFAGTADALDARVTISATNLTRVSLTPGSAATCGHWSVSPMTCTFPRFAAGGARQEFRATFVAPVAGPASVDVEVTATNDYAAANNHYRFDFNVLPDARFVLASAAPLYPAVKPNQVFEVDWVVANTGVIPATAARAELSITDKLEFLSLQTPSGAPCTRDASFNWLCPLGTVAPGAQVPLKLRLRAADIPHLRPGSMSGGNVWLKVAAAEPIFDYDNGWLGAGVTITPKIADVYVELAAPPSALVGSQVTVRLQVGNRGPDETVDVNSAMRDWTGRGLLFDSATPSSGSCAKEGDYMVCRFATLASGETIEVTAQATVGSEAGDYDVFASAGTSQSYDPDRENNEGRSLFSSLAMTPAPSPPPAPAPAPAPAPEPAPAPSPPPTVSAPAPASSGGGGAALDLLLLVLGTVAFRSLRARRAGARRLLVISVVA
jgi:hypothetical protein